MPTLTKAQFKLILCDSAQFKVNPHTWSECSWGFRCVPQWCRSILVFAEKHYYITIDSLNYKCKCLNVNFNLNVDYYI